MALNYHIAGPAAIKVDTGDANAWQTLGYTRDGVSLRDESAWLEYYADSGGGDRGIPIEIIHLGQFSRVRL